MTGEYAEEPLVIIGGHLRRHWSPR
jgi:hypothetical protein